MMTSSISPAITNIRLFRSFFLIIYSSLLFQRDMSRRSSRTSLRLSLDRSSNHPNFVSSAWLDEHCHPVFIIYTRNLSTDIPNIRDQTGNLIPLPQYKAKLKKQQYPSRYGTCSSNNVSRIIPSLFSSSFSYFKKNQKRIL